MEKAYREVGLFCAIFDLMKRISKQQKTTY